MALAGRNVARGDDSGRGEGRAMANRTFTIELTEDEAATVWRMAELSGLPAGQIVRHLHRTSLFNVAVSLATTEWLRRDDETGCIVPLEPAAQQRQFREYMGILLDGCGAWRSGNTE